MKLLRFVYLHLIYSKFSMANISHILTNDSLSGINFLSQTEAINVDQELFNLYKFSVDQLMELAGLSVATSIYESGKIDSFYKPPAKILIICGPGNNGGDGLVAARHLKLFGYEPEIMYPKPGKSELFSNLVNQCKMMNITFVSSSIDWLKYKLIVDAVFGFSFKPPVRVEFSDIITKMSQLDNSKHRLISIDIPSGWNVETGPDPLTPILKPNSLVSLTAPKQCARYFSGTFHWLGGRFVPPALADKYQLNLPQYEHTQQCLLLSLNDQQ